MNKNLEFNEIDWETWQANMNATLIFVQDKTKNRVLLIRKKRGLGEGKINGPGGKIDKGETPLEGAVRELQEELCITAKDPQKHGELKFQFTDGLAIHCHVFVSYQWEGIPTETDEAIPVWFELEDIPYQEMWEDDKIWLPRVLKHQDKFKANFLFDGEKMLGKTIKWE